MTNKMLLPALFHSLLLSSLFFPYDSFAQQPSTSEFDAQSKVTIKMERPADSSIARKLKVYNPGSTAFRSAVLPGWGQIYNRKYWKLPIVWGTLGITGYIFADNIKTYRDYRNAYAIRYRASLPFPYNDSTGYDNLKEAFKKYSLETIRNNRDRFRKYIDYSVLFFVLFWGLNVVDAAVDAHLKSFDVSPDLSFTFKTGYSEMAHTNGISFVLLIGRIKKSKLFLSNL